MSVSLRRAAAASFGKWQVDMSVEGDDFSCVAAKSVSVAAASLSVRYIADMTAASVRYFSGSWIAM